MFYFGMIENGVRGFAEYKDPIDEQVDDPSSYGIDWQDSKTQEYCIIMSKRNVPDALGNNNPFMTHQPHEDQLARLSFLSRVSTVC